MIPIASGVRVWIATGHTDMRRGMNSLASSLGYKQASAKLYLSRIARFSRFAAARGSRPIGEAIVDSYLFTFTTDSPRIAAVSALQHARRVAPERFIASIRSLPAPSR
ncbi:hypothetical protein [Bradyrhizobium sp. 153]|uniref:hypothetical protein n=1 Tax=Bradyrhizobium sp. 153 TaxID=2782627 RepID=UPI001FF71509|nr:hypothetical protein [Bradyrhizobium sp. 153]